MRPINIMTLILMAITMSMFTACDSSNTSGVEIVETTNSYIIDTLENRDIPTNASMLARSDDTKIKITRDIESDDIMNVYVIVGSVEVSEF